MPEVPPDARHLLFICSQNQWRSPTAEALFDDHPHYVARSAGTEAGARITAGLLTQAFQQWPRPGGLLARSRRFLGPLRPGGGGRGHELGRSSACPCGSGQKYKDCYRPAETAAAARPGLPPGGGVGKRKAPRAPEKGGAGLLLSAELGLMPFP